MTGKSGITKRDVIVASLSAWNIVDAALHSAYRHVTFLAEDDEQLHQKLQNASDAVDQIVRHLKEMHNKVVFK